MTITQSLAEWPGTCVQATPRLADDHDRIRDAERKKFCFVDGAAGKRRNHREAASADRGDVELGSAKADLATASPVWLERVS